METTCAAEDRASRLPCENALARKAITPASSRAIWPPRGREGPFSRFPSRRIECFGRREMARIEEDVVQGQLLDVRAQATDLAAVEAVYALKTASYTVRGPLVMGALLAGCPAEQVAALAEFAVPLGVAFQLRDDVLGAFGHERTTGKGVGNDLRKGKRTALVVEAGRHPVAAAAIERVLGRADAGEADVAAVCDSLFASGVLAEVESRIANLVSVSRAALERVALDADGRALLAEAAVVLTERTH